MFESRSDLLNYIKSKDINYINFCWFDMIGKRFTITIGAENINDDFLINGIRMPHGHGNLLIKPDISTTCIDVQCAYPALSIICDIYSEEEEYLFCPRGIAKKAYNLLNCSAFDSIKIAVSLEYFIFDDVRYAMDSRSIFAQVHSDEGYYAAQKEKEYGNHGHRVGDNNGMSSSQPNDTLYDLRVETVENLKKTGIAVESHCHAGGMAQALINLSPANVLQACDNINKAKYIIKGTAASYGKTATFMPKPLHNIAGSSTSLSIILNKNNKNLIDHCDTISKDASAFIGGIFKNINTIMAFTNASTNSYKRLIDRLSANHIICDRHNNLSAVCVPYHTKEHGILCRFPDGSMNPYLGITAIIAAGIDGIESSLEISKNKLLPPRRFTDSLVALKKDGGFLLKKGILTQEQVDSYIELKYEEVEKIESVPHPVEFHMSYGV